MANRHVTIADRKRADHGDPHEEVDVEGEGPQRDHGLLQGPRSSRGHAGHGQRDDGQALFACRCPGDCFGSDRREARESQEPRLPVRLRGCCGRIGRWDCTRLCSEAAGWGVEKTRQHADLAQGGCDRFDGALMMHRHNAFEQVESNRLDAIQPRQPMGDHVLLGGAVHGWDMEARCGRVHGIDRTGPLW
jgi:hypothetical protein